MMAVTEPVALLKVLPFAPERFCPECALSLHTDDVDWFGLDDLHYRALEGDVAGVNACLDAGAHVAARDCRGSTALHFAAEHSHLAAVNVLLAAGAPVDAVDQYGNTPLWSAVLNSQGRSRVIVALLSAGADPDLVNNGGETPRELAQRSCTEGVRALLVRWPARPVPTLI
jgi:26S proteasome non-ATPase regulatory subunit 10